MDLPPMIMMLIPKEELDLIKSTQQEILVLIQRMNDNRQPVSQELPGYLTAREFMAAVKICRSKFDQLVLGNKIKTIKKRRKIYVPAGEAERYFTDPSIQ